MRIERDGVARAGRVLDIAVEIALQTGHFGAGVAALHAFVDHVDIAAGAIQDEEGRDGLLARDPARHDADDREHDRHHQEPDPEAFGGQILLEVACGDHEIRLMIASPRALSAASPADEMHENVMQARLLDSEIAQARSGVHAGGQNVAGRGAVAERDLDILIGPIRRDRRAAEGSEAVGRHRRVAADLDALRQEGARAGKRAVEHLAAARQ